MNRRPTLLFVLAGVVLGGIGLYLSWRNSRSFVHVDKLQTEQLLGDFPVNSIARLTLRGGTNEVNLIKDGVWKVQERSQYPAQAEAVVRFVRQLWDLRPAQSQKIGPSQLGRLDLLAPEPGRTNSGMLVELKGADGKVIRSLLLGKPSLRGGDGDPSGGGGWPNGRWIYLPDKPGTAFLVSEPFSDIETRPEQWVSKDFFRVEKAHSVEVDFPVATNSWKLTRETETAEWKLANTNASERLDPAKAAGISNPFSSPSFVDVSPGDKVSEGATNPPTVIRVGTFDGFEYTVKVGSKTNEDFPLTVGVTAQIAKERVAGKDEKPEDKAKLDKEFKERREKLEDKLKQEQSFGQWTYRVSGWLVEPFLKERSQLLVEQPKVETPAPAGSKTNAVNPGGEPKLEDPPLPAIQPR